MRVLLVNDRPPGGPGGTEVHLALLADALREAGDDVSFFHPDTPAGRLRGVWDLRARHRLQQHLGASRPDVVHVHHVTRELSAAVLAPLRDLPCVLTAHDGRLLGDADGQTRLLRGYQRARAPLDAAAARRVVDVTLAVSTSLADRYAAAGFPRVRRARAWPARPVSRSVPVPGCTDVVMVGRLDPDKGTRVALNAWRRAAAARPEGARLVLVGEGSLLAEAQSTPGVVATGRLDAAGVSEVLGRARVVLVPSLPSRRPEGAPLVVLEALAHGRPLVVSDDPGVVEAAGGAALVVSAGDVEALADALVAVATDDALAARLAAACAGAAAGRTAADGVAQVRAAYREAIELRAGRT